MIDSLHLLLALSVKDQETGKQDEKERHEVLSDNLKAANAGKMSSAVLK